jgi:predicted dithiol-disulfide oxidoreductase (DUF899 family)
MFHRNNNTQNDDSENIITFNLDQGKDILQYNDDMDKIVSPHLKLIQSNLLVEGLSGTGTNTSYVNKKALEGLQNIENKFNQTLALYTQTYSQFSEDMLAKRQSNRKIVDYLGKVVTDTDGNNHYVNSFGYTHKYSPNAWENNNSSCPSTTVSYSNNMSNFQTSLPMVQGQPCKIAGQNIKNKDSGEEAWVDIKGIKHPYSNNDNNDKNQSCQTKSIEMNGTDYNLIPTGGAMSRTDECLSLDVNPILWTRLQKLNTKLKRQAIQLTEEINRLSLEDNEATQQLLNKRQQLLSYIDSIDDGKNDIENSNTMIMRIVGEEGDSRLRMNSNYYSYIIWIFLMIFIVMLIIAASTNDNDKVTGISYVIIAMATLIFLSYLYNKLIIFV